MFFIMDHTILMRNLYGLKRLKKLNIFKNHFYSTLAEVIQNLIEKNHEYK